MSSTSRLSCFALALLLYGSMIDAKAKKPKDEGTQQTYGCVVLTGIRFHGFLMNIESVIENRCGYPVSLSVTIGYFNRKGVQIGTGYDFPTVATSASFRLRHWASDDGPPVGTSFMSIIAVTVVHA